MNTCSWSFPNMIDVSRNKIAVARDNVSIVNRVRLLIMTEPTELYMNPNYGVGLKRYMYQYNSDNIVSIIKDRIIDQLRLWEPCVDPDKTIVEKGLKYSNPNDINMDPNHLELTVTVYTIYGDTLTISVDTD